MRRVIAVCVVAMGFAAENVSAQEGALSRLYGQGVHAYFGGNLAGAEKLFTQAINAGSQDPRLHYFRGLIYLQAGRKQAADAEFEKGAELEVGATRAYDVSMALERVQGRPRLALEQHRAARLAEGTSATQTQRRQRLENIRSREPETTVPATPNRLDAITGDAVPGPATQPEVSTPFADPMDAAPADAPLPKAATPTPPVEETTEDPFGGNDALPADTATPPADAATEEESPFGDEEMPADTTPPAEKAPGDGTPPAEEAAPPTDETEDPFANEDAVPTTEETPPADDATPPADDTTPPADETTPPADDAAPAEETPPAEEADDPFGGGETPAETPPADETPAETPPADEEDPFSG